MAKLPSKLSNLLHTFRCATRYLSRMIVSVPLLALREIEELAPAEAIRQTVLDAPEPEITPAGLSCPVAPDQGDGLGVRKSNAVGGQAVIEGVMMRASNHVATAVRAPNGQIVCRIQEFPSLAQKSKTWKRPILRGAGMLFETLKLGIATLDWSAKIAAEIEDDKSKQTLGEKIVGFVSVPIGLLAGIALFLWFPYAVAKWTIGNDGNQFLYHLVANAVRITILIGYMSAISLSKEVRRVFEYHGAEHKGISTYESGDPVEPERMVSHTRFHPRCGTSFLLVLAVVTMIFFSIFDSTLQAFGFVFHNAVWRVLAHLPFIPVVAGIGYELLKWSDRHKAARAVSLIIQPGLWMQRITTREPDLKELAVSAVSLKSAIMGSIVENDTVVSELNYKAA